MKIHTAAELIEKKQAILFDLFHTLVTVGSSGGVSTSEILGVSRDEWNKQLMEKTPERLTGKMKDPMEILRKMARAINPLITEETIERALLNRIKKFAEALLYVPEETIYTLKKLRSAGKKIGLVSNAEVSEIEEWEKSPLAPLFDTSVFSCYAGVIKPEKEIYELCMRDLKAAPDECVFAGDGGSQELEGAKRLGITTVIITGFIKDMRKEKLDERKQYADYVIENIRELIF